MSAASPGSIKPPRSVLEGIYAFPPNRDTLGGTAYFLQQSDDTGTPANTLIDAPAWNEDNQAFLTAQGGVRWLVITHRGGLGQSAKLQKALDCEVIIQEQEAYLLPQTPTTPFQERLRLSPQVQVIWTPGHTPGSSCLYYAGQGGVLFTGRHLLPTTEGEVAPLRFAKTFHWPRQLRQIQKLQQEFSAATLSYLCPGANTGFLRGQRVVTDAYRQLKNLQIENFAQVQPLL